jgi:hypothetical protein
VENVAREWRAGFCNWRARVRIPNTDTTSEQARRTQTKARQLRAEFSTGGV